MKRTLAAIVFVLMSSYYYTSFRNFFFCFGHSIYMIFLQFDSFQMLCFNIYLFPGILLSKECSPLTNLLTFRVKRSSFFIPERIIIKENLVYSLFVTIIIMMIWEIYTLFIPATITSHVYYSPSTLSLVITKPVIFLFCFYFLLFQAQRYTTLLICSFVSFVFFLISCFFFVAKERKRKTWFAFISISEKDFI